MKVAVLASVLVLVLGGCAVLDTPSESSPPTGGAATSPVVVKPPPPRPATPQPVRIDPARLQGISGDQAVAMLGRPQADEPQQLGRLWRWRKGACVLTLALYPEVQGGGLRVVASDFAGTSDPGACLGAMVRPGGGDGR